MSFLPRFSSRVVLVRVCSPALLLTGPFSHIPSNLLWEGICFQLPLTPAAPPSQSEAPLSCSCFLGYHHGSDAPPSLALGMVHKAQKRRCPEEDAPTFTGTSPLCLILGTLLGFTEIHWALPAAPLPEHDGIPPAPAQQHGHGSAELWLMSRAVLAEIPSSSPLNPDGSQHNLAAAEPSPPQPSAFEHHHHHLNHPSARGRGPGHPSAGAPGRDLLHPEKTPLFPDSHTHTHTQGKVNTAAASSHQIRAEHHSLIVTA